MSSARTVSPLIVTRKPTRASRELATPLTARFCNFNIGYFVSPVMHQDSITSSDEDWDDPSPLPPPSPSPSPSPYPPTTTTPLPDPGAQTPSQPKPAKKKKRIKGSFLFRRKKKRGSAEEVRGAVISDGGEDGVDFADVLEHPSLVHLRPMSGGGRHLSLPAPPISRSLSDSQVIEYYHS